MKSKELLYKIIPVFCTAVLFSLNVYAQQLANTDWVSITNMHNSIPTRLHFGKDTLSLKSFDEKPAFTMSFSEKHDTLLLFNSSDKNNCPTADTAFYNISYQYGSQHIFLSAIKESCNYRRSLFRSGFNYIPAKGSGA